MKCIALLTSFMVMALAAPEPYFGRDIWTGGLAPLGGHYAGVGLPFSRYAGAYGRGRFNTLPYAYRNAQFISTPTVQPALVAAVPAVRAAIPVAVPAVVPEAVPAVVPAAVPAVSPIVYTDDAIVVPAAVPAIPAALPVDVPAVSPYVSTGEVIALPSAPSTIQFHRQDEFGNYEYGYDNVNSAKHEIRNADVGVRGTYTVKDVYGPRTINYVADALGFRVSPAHLSSAPTLLRHKRQAAIVASNPVATRPAVLMRIELNPGHATFYRVY